MMIPRAIATIGMMCLFVILPRVSSAETPGEADPREREIREATEQRVREIERVERLKNDADRALREAERVRKSLRKGREREPELEWLYDELVGLRVKEYNMLLEEFYALKEGKGGTQDLRYALERVSEQIRQREQEILEARERRERDMCEGVPGEPGPPAPHELEAEVDRLQAELQELRVRELDLRTEMETMELEGRPGEAHERRRDLVRVRHELQRHELEVDRLMTEQHRQAERHELVRMEERLEYVSNWKDVAFDPRDAVMMATQSIVELHMMIGEPQGAAEALERLLESVEELGSRTAIRFALKDVYAEMGNRERAQEHMTKVILENARAVSAFQPR